MSRVMIFELILTLITTKQTRIINARTSSWCSTRVKYNYDWITVRPFDRYDDDGYYGLHVQQELKGNKLTTATMKLICVYRM